MLMLAAALAATAVAGCGKNNISQEQTTEAENSNRIYGVITDVSASEQTITVDNQSDVSSTGEIGSFHITSTSYKDQSFRIVFKVTTE